MSFKEPDLPVPDLSKSELPKVIKDKKEEAKARLKKQKDKYTTLFRKKPKLPTCKNFLPKLPKIDMVTFGLGGGFLVVILAWYSLQYYELFLPFAGGALRLFKYFLICTGILYFMVTFVQASSSFYWWYTSTLYYFRRFINPLLNQKVKYQYYRFTDYINWMIYYPARIYYFVRFMANVLFFLLVILPIMAFIAFFIGLLFSWIGEPKDGESVMDPIVKDLNSAATVVSSAASSVASSATNAVNNVAKVVGSVGSNPSTPGPSNLNPSKIDSKLDPSKLESIKALGVDPSKLPEMLKDPIKMTGLLKTLDTTKMNQLIDLTQGTPAAATGAKVKGILNQFPGILDKAKSMVGIVPKLLMIQANPIKMARVTASLATSALTNSKVRNLAPVIMTEMPKLSGKTPEQILDHVSTHPQILTAIMGASDAIVKAVN